MFGYPVTTCSGNGCSAGCRWSCLLWCIFCAVFFLFCAVFWMRSGTELSQFRNIFLPTLTYQRLSISGSAIQYSCRLDKRSINLSMLSLTGTIFSALLQVVISLIFEVKISFESSNECCCFFSKRVSFH